MPEQTSHLDAIDFWDLVEHGSDPVQIVRADGTFLYVNQAWCRTLGYSRDEVASLSLRDILSPNPDSPLWDAFQRVIQGEQIDTVNCTLTTRDNRLVVMDASLSCRFQDGHPVVVRFVLRDRTEHLRADAELQFQEHRYQSLVTSLGGMVWNNGPDGELLGFNPEWTVLTGQSFEQVRTGQWLEILHPDDRERTAARWQEALASGKPYETTFRVLHGNGGLRHLLARGQPVLDGQGQVREWVGILLDITELHQAEELLRDSQQILRMVLDNIPLGVFWKDRDSRYLGCNRVVARAFGLKSPGEIVGKTDHQLGGLTREQADFFILKDRQVMQSNAAEYGIIEMATLADGTSIWMETNKSPMRDVSGNVVGILGTWQDITERKRVEDALQLERTRYRYLFEHSPIAIWEEDLSAVMEWLAQIRQRGITDLRGYFSSHPDEMRYGLSLVRIVDVNQAALQQHSAQTKEQLAQHLSVIISESLVIAFLDELEAIGQGKKASMEFESHSQRLDGRRLDLIIHIEPARQGNDLDWSRVIVTGTDITERKRAEEERRQFEAQIQHAQKLESLGILAGGVAHDFNNLLTCMLGFAGLARMQLSEESPVIPMLGEIEKAAQRAADLTQQMLAYSGRGRFVIQALRLDKLVHEMAKLLLTVISKKASLRLDLNPVTMEGDATQIRQVIMNLITNASDALGDHGGEIVLRTGQILADRNDLQSPFLPEELPAGPYAYVEVEDNGCGMTAETIPQIFDPFFTTKFTGRGLGLAAVLGIVKGHKGVVKVSSTPAQGTTFQVMFPCVAEPGGEERDTGLERAPLKCQGTVLVVEDESNLREFARTVLVGAGFQVIQAGDGQEGLDLFRQHHSEVIAVLLDLTMPKMDGMETLRELRQQDTDVPVLLMSGYSESEVSLRFQGLGVNGFIQKPFYPRELISMLCQLIRSDGSECC